MLPPLALTPQPGCAVLDMCASPGGKTSFAAQMTGRQGFVLANEPGADRLATLRQNLARMNLPQAVTCGCKGQDLDAPAEGFSHILLDPPCSGWGTAQKNPQVLTLWRQEKVAPLASLQRELLARAADLLTPGGRLLYSTCTTNKAENEEQAVWAQRTLGLVPVPLEPFPGFCFHEPLLPEAAGTLRVDGEGSQAQGFYLALFTKPGNGSGAASNPQATSGHSSAMGMPGMPRARRQERPLREALTVAGLGEHAPGLSWAKLPAGTLELFKDELCLIPDRGLGLLPVRRKGQRLGALKGGAFKPWARLRLLAPPAGSGPELDAQEPDVIVSLLEGRSVDVSCAPARMALYFRGLPLGFLTVKGQRALWSDR